MKKVLLVFLVLSGAQLFSAAGGRGRGLRGANQRLVRPKESAEVDRMFQQSADKFIARRRGGISRALPEGVVLENSSLKDGLTPAELKEFEQRVDKSMTRRRGGISRALPEGVVLENSSLKDDLAPAELEELGQRFDRATKTLK